VFPGFALAGALPALVVMLIVDRLDARRPEPRWSLRRVTLAGALSILPALVIELVLMKLGPKQGYEHALYEGFVVAAMTEEAGKALCVRWFVYGRPEFDERTDGIVYGVRAGLGFAIVENVGALLGAKTLLAMVGVFFMRALLAVPLHAFSTAVMGHFAAWRRFERRGPGMLGGYLAAVLMHGSYDAAIFGAVWSAKIKQTELAGGLLLVPLAVVVLGGLWVRVLWRKALARDDATLPLQNV
jgi:RsiW-degrading membrane proteinase PrsW (M82 family)